jgi:hypothetical protein
MGKAWVLSSFKHLLIDSCQEYINSTDKSKEKSRTALITRVAVEIRHAVEGTTEGLPDDLEKVR